jgi:hypothetical protein
MGEPMAQGRRGDVRSAFAVEKAYSYSGSNRARLARPSYAGQLLEHTSISAYSHGSLWFEEPSFTPTKIHSGGLSEWLQGHFVAQTFQPVDQGSADSVHVDPVKVIRTEFPVVFLTLQHVIGNN